MKKNLFIALFALFLATPSWATIEIVGSSTLCRSEMYYLTGVPNGSTITWDTVTSIQKVNNHSIINLTPNLNMVTITRGTYYLSPVAPLDTNSLSFYSGDITLMAYVSNGSNTDTITKEINMPPFKKPVLPGLCLSSMVPNETRVFSIINCDDVADNMLKWVITLPSSSTVTYYGHSWTYTATRHGTLNIKLYNLTACPEIFSEYSVFINYFFPVDPLALAIQVPNPVTTGSIDIQVLSPDSVNSREDIDYTLELWSENSRLERTINSTISGEKDVVSMDAAGLRNGIYLLLLKVDNKVISTSKLIINR